MTMGVRGFNGALLQDVLAAQVPASSRRWRLENEAITASTPS